MPIDCRNASDYQVAMNVVRTDRSLTPSDDSAGPVDALVVGGGVVGLATAFFLGRGGLRTLLIERNATPMGETSSKSGEGIRAQWERPHNIRMMLAALDLYDRFEDVVGVRGASAGLRRIGYLYAATSAEGAVHLEARARRQAAAGLDDIEILRPEDLRRRFPFLSPDVALALFRAGDGVLSAKNVADGYLRSGAFAVRSGVAALRPLFRGGRVVGVTTSTGDIFAGATILCAGPWSAGWLAGIDGAPPMALVRGSIVHLDAPGVPADHPATIDADRGSFWRPDESGARITAPLLAPVATNDPSASAPHEPDYLARALASVAPVCPFWRRLGRTVAAHRVFHGVYPVTPDGAPVIGRLPPDGLYINGGYGGHGVMGSIEGARRLAEILLGGPRSADASFPPDRFACGIILEPEPMTVNLAGEDKAWFGAAEGLASHG